MARVSRAAIWTLYFIVFVDFFQISFVFPLIPKIVESFGKGATEIGLLASIAAAGEGIAAPYLGSLADRVGRRPVFILAMAGCMVSSITIGFANSYYFLLVGRLLEGICGGTASVAAAYIADVTTEEERPGYMTYFQAAIFAGLTFGPVVGGLMNHEGGFRTACFVAAAICGVNLVCMLAFLPDSHAARSPEAGGTSDGRQPRLPWPAWVLAVASLLNGAGWTAFEALGVLYVQDSFFPGNPDEATLFYSIVISGVGVVGMVVSLVLYAPLEKAIGLKACIVFGGLLSGLSFGAIGFPVDKWWFFGWVQGVVFAENVSGTSIQTILTYVVHPSQFGRAIGVMTLFQNVARALGPFAFGPVYEHFNHGVPWYTNAVLKVLTVCLCITLPQKRSVQDASAPGPADGECNADEQARTTRHLEERALTGQTVHSFVVPGSAGLALVRQLSEKAPPARPLLARTITWAAGQAGSPQPSALERARSAT